MHLSFNQTLAVVSHEPLRRVPNFPEERLQTRKENKISIVELRNSVDMLAIRNSLDVAFQLTTAILKIHQNKIPYSDFHNYFIYEVAIKIMLNHHGNHSQIKYLNKQHPFRTAINIQLVSPGLNIFYHSFSHSYKLLNSHCLFPLLKHVALDFSK